ncbi:CDP-glycerol glycerophosphotransferase family protein [Psychrilyobacter sp.]|uniref:CDP-glycerol glycerophosphotransferase family protein n=1 Tax=Psychrilyobacter sp. TaxID=2586924 RepID=UPI0030190D76
MIKKTIDYKTIAKKLLITLKALIWGVVGLVFIKVKSIMKNELWLIGETDITAQDNGYHLFKYIRGKYPDKECYYLIDSNSPDKEKVEILGNVIYHGSFKHLIYLFQAEKHIGSHDYRYWHYPGYSKIFSKIFGRYIKGKFIQIQHGIIHIKSERGFHYDPQKPYDMVCVSSKYEKKLLEDHFNHPKKVVKITGLCRYDELENQEIYEKFIVFMPTWRKGLHKKEEFLSSGYCRLIEEFLSDKEFLSLLRTQNIKLILYLHVKLQHHSEYFKKYENDVLRIVKLGEESVQDLIKKGNLMITDYSSVSLDFTYLNKPVLFYQWDFEEYVRSYDVQNPEEYQKMRFGYICRSKSELVERIKGYLADDYKVKSIHKEKSDIYFEYRDRKNGKRIYEAIEEL